MKCEFVVVGLVFSSVVVGGWWEGVRALTNYMITYNTSLKRLSIIMSKRNKEPTGINLILALRV